jgi:hypothetical protein
LVFVIRTEYVLYEVETEAVLMMQMNLSFQSATLGSTIVLGLKQATRIFVTQTEIGSNPGTSHRFFFLPNRPEQLWVQPSSLLNRQRGSFGGLRQRTHPPPSSAEVKNKWSYTSAICTRQGRRQEKFTPFKTEKLTDGRGEMYIYESHNFDCSPIIRAIRLWWMERGTYHA